MPNDMYTSFSKLYAAPPREAERADARYELRRHDPDQERRKNEREKKEPQSLFNEEDYALVSVEALRVFLQNFLKNQSASATAGEPQEQTAPKAPAQGRAARAANAYAHASETGASGKYIDAPAPSAQAAPGLSEGDSRAINKLLEDLKTLSARRIEHLRIERGESFLQSLVHATEKALSF